MSTNNIEKMPAKPDYKNNKKKFLNIRRAFAKSDCKFFRDDIIFQLLEQGIDFDDFMVYDHVDEYGISFKLRTVKNRMPPQFRHAVIKAFNKARFGEDCEDQSCPIRLISEFPKFKLFNATDLKSDERIRDMCFYAEQEAHNIYYKIMDWQRKNDNNDCVLLWPGYCEVADEPRIYASITANSGCVAKFSPGSDPEQVEEFIRTLPEYEAFCDYPYSRFV